MNESIETMVGRIDERVLAVERDVKEIKAAIRPAWPSVVAALVAASALVITLIDKL